MAEHREMHCCGCGGRVQARLTSGAEVYPHRADLSGIPIWRCDVCGNYVGCHRKTDRPTQPLGTIPTSEIRRLRIKIHAMIDPMWKSGRLRRKWVYAEITRRIGKEFHTGEINSAEEANRIIGIVNDIITEVFAYG